MNEQLWKILSPTANDTFAKMKGKELQEILYFLKDFYLKPKEILNINKKNTFGLEIEFEQANYEKIKSLLKQMQPTSKQPTSKRSWILDKDLTLTNGGEIISPPLTDTTKTWESLTKICTMLENNAAIDKYSGGHIHFGAQIIGNTEQNWLNFIKLWYTYENIIFRFTNGEYTQTRPRIDDIATPLSKELQSDYQHYPKGKISFPHTRFIHGKYKAINFGHITNPEYYQKRNTIEFRSPNGTLNPVIWQNNVLFFNNLLEYAKQENFNTDAIEQRFQHNQENQIYTLEYYNEIYLQQALELADMIYQNNQDKIYFLRQYFKDFNTSPQKYQKTKNFTKKS